ncbi:MAG: hypothetical protein ACW98Y_21385 [Candidatus Thorarchaeota archaeon]|jgi:hypothetical protein
MMQNYPGPIALALYVFSIVALLIFIQKLAIGSYRDNNYSATSWFSTLGKKLANSKSLKFSITWTTVLIGTTLITLTYSLNSWILLLTRPRFPVLLASLWPAFFLLIYLLLGLLYVTLTPRGLAWWDANVVIFRYTGLHARRSYLKGEITDLIDENQEGFEDPYRAYLTLERLFNHEFGVGSAARDIMEKTAPEYHKEFESKLFDSSDYQRHSYFLLLIGIVVGFLSGFFFVFGFYIHLPLYDNTLIVDGLVAIFLSFLLMWMIHSTLELPIMRPSRYISMRSDSVASDDIQNAS